MATMYFFQCSIRNAPIIAKSRAFATVSVPRKFFEKGSVYPGKSKPEFTMISAAVFHSPVCWGNSSGTARSLNCNASQITPELAKPSLLALRSLSYNQGSKCDHLYDYVWLSERLRVQHSFQRKYLIKKSNIWKCSQSDTGAEETICFFLIVETSHCVHSFSFYVANV